MDGTIDQVNRAFTSQQYSPSLRSPVAAVAAP